MYKILQSVVVILLLTSTWLNAQNTTTITGTVTDDVTNDPLIGVNVIVKGKLLGTTTNSSGQFSLAIDEPLPITLQVSIIGYETTEIEVTQNQTSGFQVALKERVIQGREVVVSASRVEESVLESPVSVETMDILAIRETPSANFYDAIADLKGVQMTTSSLTFKAVNTRGFNSIANLRFVQLVDNMDNAAPGLNFPTGNLLGISELDLEGVELVPGAASALYGPNAFNGILFLKSKNPFMYQGLSVMAKGGVTSQSAAGTNPFGDFAIRYAKAFNDKFAFKINVAALVAEDWHATDYNDMDADPTNAAVRGPNSPSYNAVNMYGDEIATTLDLGQLGKIRVGRTGYKEQDLTDYNVASYKADAALHYRITKSLEASYVYRFGMGKAVYQGASRYSLKNLQLQQHKLELRGDNFFVRGYGTFENAGDSYDMRFAAWNINRGWKEDVDWFGDYAAAYVGAVPGVNGQDHAAARAYADTGRLIPGTPEFEAKKAEITALADLAEGSKFIDKTNMYHVEGNYDFSSLIKVFDFQIGGNYRAYNLRSEGTIFNDADGPISIYEYGAYGQVSKKMIQERLKLTASLRYDKNQNFDGNFSPRASVVVSLGQRKQHNFRGSFQTGFRNPATQSQYIGLDLGVAALVGGTRDNIENYSTGVDIPSMDTTVVVTGTDVYGNSYTVSSVLAFAASGDDNLLEKAEIEYVKPEKITSFEIGYKGLIGEKFYLDLNYYYNSYKNFEANINVMHPLTGTVGEVSGIADIGSGRTKVFQLYTNATGIVISQGVEAALSYSLPKGYRIGGNYAFADFDIQDSNPDLVPGFNTPKHRFGANFGNRNVVKNFGFNIAFRWSDSYLWETSFGSGTLPAYGVLDIQFSYKIPSIKSILKLGGANVLNQEYRQAFGSPMVGSQYYISITFDEMLN